jgi:hypothetical protein
VLDSGVAASPSGIAWRQRQLSRYLVSATAYVRPTDACQPSSTGYRLPTRSCSICSLVGDYGFVGFSAFRLFRSCTWTDSVKQLNNGKPIGKQCLVMLVGGIRGEIRLGLAPSSSHAGSWHVVFALRGAALDACPGNLIRACLRQLLESLELGTCISAESWRHSSRSN